MAALAMKRQGTTNNMINAMFDTVSNMEKSIRTVYGDSELIYKQSTTKNHGILQENGAGLQYG
jgi:hypothetical protein